MAGHSLEESARSALRGGSFLLSVSFVLSFLVNVLQLAGPLFIILIYDRVLTSRSHETLLALLFMVGVLITTLGLLDYARKRIVARFAAQFQERLERTILGAAQQNAMFPTDSAKPVVGLDQADHLRSFFHSGGLIAVMDFIWAPIFVVVVFVLHPLLGYICLAGLLLMAALVFVQLAFVGGREDKCSLDNKDISELKDMATASREVVRGQSMGPGFKAKWLMARDKARDNAIALRDWTASFDQMSTTALMLIRYGVLAAGAWLVLDGKLTVGAMVAAAFLVTRVFSPVNQFLRTVPQMFRAVDSWKRLKNILKSWERSVPDAFPTQPANPNTRMSIQGLSVKSPLTGTMALRQLSLDVESGTIAEIIGKTGQGKTALAEAILGLAPRTSGAILIDGTNTARMTDEEMASAIGYIPETPRFIAGTIADNISRLDPDMTPEKVSAAARKACLHGRISELPNGYQTMIDPAGTLLPSGERQQLSLARALYHQPKVLLVDAFDEILLERLPETMTKTFRAHLASGGAIVFLARKPLTLGLPRLQYRLEKGTLGRPVQIAPDQTGPSRARSLQMGRNVTVIGDKGVGKVAPDD